MQFVLLDYMKLPKINMAMKRDLKVELFYLLIWLAQKEHKTHNITTKKEGQKVLRLINHYSLSKNAYEQWTAKLQEVIYRFDKQNLLWFYETLSQETKTSQG